LRRAKRMPMRQEQCWIRGDDSRRRGTRSFPWRIGFAVAHSLEQDEFEQSGDFENGQ
jgi:hypothetical protein